MITTKTESWGKDDNDADDNDKDVDEEDDDEGDLDKDDNDKDDDEYHDWSFHKIWGCNHALPRKRPPMCCQSSETTQVVYPSSTVHAIIAFNGNERNSCH